MNNYIKRKDALDIIRKHVHVNNAPITTAHPECVTQFCEMIAAKMDGGAHE